MQAGTLTGPRPRTSDDVPAAENSTDNRLADALVGGDEQTGESCYFCGAPAEGHAALYSPNAVRRYIDNAGHPPAQSEPVCRDCGERLNAHRRGEGILSTIQSGNGWRNTEVAPAEVHADPDAQRGPTFICTGCDELQPITTATFQRVNAHGACLPFCPDCVSTGEGEEK